MTDPGTTSQNQRSEWQTPYYAVIFSSQRTLEDGSPVMETTYQAMADEMERLATQREGFLGIESFRDAQGAGVTISYWSSVEAIHQWGQDSRHRLAQQEGQATWYEHYTLRITKVESEMTWSRVTGATPESLT